jgi:uncharacterized phosphosugar-binding protein
MRSLLVLLCLMVLPGCATSRPVAAAATPAGAYLDWTLRTLDAVDADMARITQAAELAAERYVAGKLLTVRGGVGLNDELSARSGGFVTTRGQKPGPGDIVLYALGVTTARQPDARKTLDVELAEIEQLRGKDVLAIGIASFEQLQSLGMLERAQAACAVLLDNHAPAEDGLFRDGAGRPMIPTFITANPIVAWTFCAELFGACTRRGRTPTMYQSIVQDSDRERYNRYAGRQFHDDLSVQPQAAQTLGRAYLQGMRRILVEIGRRSMEPILIASRQAAAAIADGGKAFLLTTGHYPPYHRPGTLNHDPAVFTSMNAGLKLTQTPAPGNRDYVVAIGYCLSPSETFNGRSLWIDPAALREAGRGVAWVAAGYSFKPGDLRTNEVLVDQCWPEGDAVVEVPGVPGVPGYDVRICPPSGITATAIMWMITAQTWSELQATGEE